MATSRVIDPTSLPADLPTAIRDELLEDYARESVLEALGDEQRPLHRLIFDERMPAVWLELKRLKADDYQLIDFLWGVRAAVTNDFSYFRASMRRVKKLRVKVAKTANALARLLREADDSAAGSLQLFGLFDLVRAAGRTRSIEPRLSAEQWPPMASRREWSSEAPSIAACVEAIARSAAQIEVMYITDRIEAAIGSRKANEFTQSFRYLWLHLRDRGWFTKSLPLAQVMIDAIGIACARLPGEELPDSSNMLKIMLDK